MSVGQLFRQFETEFDFGCRTRRARTHCICSVGMTGERLFCVRSLFAAGLGLGSRTYRGA